MPNHVFFFSIFSFPSVTSSKRLDAGANLTLDCWGHFQAAHEFVIWYKGMNVLSFNNSLIQMDNRISLSNSGAILKMKNLTKADSGIYQCRVISRDIMSVSVNVKGMYCYAGSLGVPDREGKMVVDIIIQCNK